MKDFLLYSQDICKSILVVYKNFFHWTGSKIVIALYSLLCSLLLSLVPGYFGYSAFYNITADVGVRSWATALNEVNSSTGAISTQDLEVIYGSFAESVVFPHMTNLLILIFCLLVVVAIFAFFFSYNSLLFTNLTKEYLNGKRIGILQNYYFNPVYLKKFFGILSWIALYGIILIVGLFLALIGWIFLKSLFPALDTFVTFALGLFTLATVVVGLFLCFLSQVSLVELLENPQNSAKQIIKNTFSVIKARGKFFFFFILIWLVIYMIADDLLGSIENTILSSPTNAETNSRILFFFLLYDLSPIIYLTIYERFKEVKPRA